MSRLETAGLERKASSSCVLVATRSTTIDGQQVTRGVTRVSADHPWAALDVFATSRAAREPVRDRGSLFWFTDYDGDS